MFINSPMTVKMFALIMMFEGKQINFLQFNKSIYKPYYKGPK